MLGVYNEVFYATTVDYTTAACCLSGFVYIELHAHVYKLPIQSCVEISSFSDMCCHVVDVHTFGAVFLSLLGSEGVQGTIILVYKIKSLA